MKGRIKSGEGALIGNAGEYYVMAELLKRGVIAALAPRNAPSFDILATQDDRTVRIRVKTKSVEYSHWQWTVKKDGTVFRSISKEQDFTILVDLTPETKDLRFYVMPTHIVNDWLMKDFRGWVQTPGKNNRPHDPSNKKRDLDQNLHISELPLYLNKWDILFRNK